MDKIRQPTSRQQVKLLNIESVMMLFYLGARAGLRDSLFVCPAGQTKELKQIAQSLAQRTLFIEL